jgi:hypothetical protein
MFATDWAYHCPPRAVAIPRALSASAISLKVRAPAFCASRMIGSTLATYLSASAFTALLRAMWSRGLWNVQGDKLCDAKRILEELHSEYGIRMPLAQFKRRIVRAMANGHSPLLEELKTQVRQLFLGD